MESCRAVAGVKLDSDVVGVLHGRKNWVDSFLAQELPTFRVWSRSAHSVRIFAVFPGRSDPDFGRIGASVPRLRRPSKRGQNRYDDTIP